MDKEEKVAEIKDILKELYRDVAEWLKFAEAKNGILLTITGVLLFGLLRMLPIKLEWLMQYEKTLMFSSLILIISMLVALASYIPMLNINKKSKKEEKRKNPNLLYYKDIAAFTKEEYIVEMEKKYNIKITNQEKAYIEDQVDQILSLANIALRKYKYFYIGVILVSLSLINIIAKIFYTYLG